MIVIKNEEEQKDDDEVDLNQEVEEEVLEGEIAPKEYAFTRGVLISWDAQVNDGTLVYAGTIEGREYDAPEYYGYFVTYA